MQLFVCHLLVLIILLRNNLLFPDKNLVSKPTSAGATGTWKGGAVPSTETAARRPCQVSFHPAAPHEGTRRRCDHHHHWDSIQRTRPSCPTQLSSSQGHRPSVKVWQPYRDHWDHRGRDPKYPAKSPSKHLFLSGVIVTAHVIKTVHTQGTLSSCPIPRLKAFWWLEQLLSSAINIRRI